jgi:hypothetical protein
MNEALDRLARILEKAPSRLMEIAEEGASYSPSAGTWSPKEVIGHLIDSAANNHQRFVRGMAASKIELPKYDQRHWVESQRYTTARWADLVNLWLLYNRHLLHVLRGMPGDQRVHVCVVGDNAPVSLAELALDYVGHLEHHLAQVFDRGQAVAGR